MAAKIKAKEKLYAEALTAIDKIYDSEEIFEDDMVEAFDSLIIEIENRKKILQDLIKGNKG